jgi:uncharacterized integral membrane protein
MQAIESNMVPEVYQGQFGTFSITDRDRQGVVIYRGALMVAAISFGMGTIAALLLQSGWLVDADSLVLNLITGLYIIFSIALGVALAKIHIYMAILHRTLQAFLAIGSLSAIVFSIQYHQPIGSIVYYQPLTILGVGFTFAALTGIFFKEAFCFNRFETKLLTFLVPLLLLGHLINILPQAIEVVLLTSWAGLFLVFAIRKVIQSIPPDIGDKSVFEYLEKQK